MKAADTISWLSFCQIIRICRSGAPSFPEPQRAPIFILGEIRNNPNITKKQLQEKLGLGKSTVDLGIKALRENGIIERIGSNKTGYWKIIE